MGTNAQTELFESCLEGSVWKLGTAIEGHVLDKVCIAQLAIGFLQATNPDHQF